VVEEDLDRWAEPPMLQGRHLSLEPLRVGHAAEMALALDDPGLHRFTGGAPATRDDLAQTYARRLLGPADGSRRWLNWVLRRTVENQAVGTVQATIGRTDGHVVAEVAWVVGTPFQGRGYATEAARVLVDWIRTQGAVTVIAHVHPDHAVSAAVARAVGLAPTDTIVDGEVRWRTPDSLHD
jgi:RimJ/RimL family protein N-acetyltransferase